MKVELLLVQKARHVERLPYVRQVGNLERELCSTRDPRHENMRFINLLLSRAKSGNLLASMGGFRKLLGQAVSAFNAALAKRKGASGRQERHGMK